MCNHSIYGYIFNLSFCNEISNEIQALTTTSTTQNLSIGDTANNFNKTISGGDSYFRYLIEKYFDNVTASVTTTFMHKMKRLNDTTRTSNSILKSFINTLTQRVSTNNNINNNSISQIKNKIQTLNDTAVKQSKDINTIQTDILNITKDVTTYVTNEMKILKVQQRLLEVWQNKTIEKEKQKEKDLMFAFLSRNLTNASATPVTPATISFCSRC